MVMNWVVYVIHREGSEVGKDLFVGHLAHGDRRHLGEALKTTLRTHMEMAEERGRGAAGTEGPEACFKLHKRMIETGPEGWKIFAPTGARTSHEVRELETMTRNLFNADLNEWVRLR